MTTGYPPFQGKTSAELASAILRDTPPLVTEIRPDSPLRLARLIHTCMEKEPSRRPENAREVASSLCAIEDGLRSASRSTVPTNSTAASTPSLLRPAGASQAHPSVAPFFTGQLGMAYALAGRHEEAKEVLRSLDERERNGEFIPSFTRWLVQGGFKDLPAIRKIFAKVIEERTAPITISVLGLPSFGSDPEIDCLHRDYFGW